MRIGPCERDVQEIGEPGAGRVDAEARIEALRIALERDHEACGRARLAGTADGAERTGHSQPHDAGDLIDSRQNALVRSYSEALSQRGGGIDAIFWCSSNLHPPPGRARGCGDVSSPGIAGAPDPLLARRFRFLLAVS